jgi:hypothetical protein
MKTTIYLSTTCPTCCRSAGNPARSYVAEKIVSGCVDHFHTGHLVFATQSLSWHMRPEAKKIRAASKAARMGGVTQVAA